MSYDALDWWYANAHRYVDLRTEPQLWVLVNLIARRTGEDPRAGAWPSQKRMAEALGGVKHETVARYIARLEAKGVIKVISRGGPQERDEDGRLTKEGRRPHLYLLPEVIAAYEPAPELPPTAQRGIGGNSGGSAPEVTSDAPAPHGSQLDPSYLRSGAELPPIRGRVTSDRPARDGGRRGTEGKEGREASASPTLPIKFPRQCSRHQDGENDRACVPCKRTRLAYEDRTAPRRVSANPRTPGRKPWE